jgi:hypothetical protein
MKRNGYHHIVEVYYDGDRPSSWCPGSLDGWEDYDDLIGTIELMRMAKYKPVLTEDDFGS